MDKTLESFIPNVIAHFPTAAVSGIHKIQSLWSGYGGIYRLTLQGASVPSVVVKCISLSQNGEHPRGWTSNLSHERKLRSYQIETHWHQHYANQLSQSTKVPQLLYSENRLPYQVLVLEDLSINYPKLKQHCTLSDARTVVKWLAQFHAHFMHQKPEGLWPVGCYWHLATRPDEWKAMEDGPLKARAKELDGALNKARFQTIVHGDAKVANFCFGKNEKVAAVDFQYVGGGVGVKDLAYFIGSCFTDDECALYENTLLDLYIDTLKTALKNSGFENTEDLEKEWRQLYPVAWADFNRFLMGWLPDHQKLHAHALSKNTEALEYLDNLKK